MNPLIAVHAEGCRLRVLFIARFHFEAQRARGEGGCDFSELNG